MLIYEQQAFKLGTKVCLLYPFGPSPTWCHTDMLLLLYSHYPEIGRRKKPGAGIEFKIIMNLFFASYTQESTKGQDKLALDKSQWNSWGSGLKSLVEV